MDRYAVLGNPVAHSLSPRIHAAFAAQGGDALHYETRLVPAGTFAQHAREFFGEGAKGANVTLPYKEEAFTLATVRTARAQRAGAVNTLTPLAGGLEGDNTDGAGLLADLEGPLGLSLAGRRIALLGAGGAARGVAGPLLERNPALLFIANRTPERATSLADRFADLGSVQAGTLEALQGPFDVVINATSTSTRGEPLALPRGLFGPGTVAYDMAYGPAAEAFLAPARALGARTSDGLGMLVAQAAEAFFRWRGRRPDTAPVLAALREAR